MVNENIYALLVGVGDYEKLNMENLPTYRMDLTLIGTAIQSGLRADKENIRIMAGQDMNGNISVKELAKSVSGFKTLLSTDDTFIFYFSGHGTGSYLCFSDGTLQLQSVIDVIEAMPAKNKIVILDCCYSGGFKTKGAREMHFEESVADYAGRGIAIFASSASDGVSRLGPNNNHSLFTGALSTAIAINKRVKKGYISLDDINDEVQNLVATWNKQNPGREQKPVYRSSMGGTVFFKVEEYNPYEQATYSQNANKYKIVEVKPMSSLTVKRLCAFVITGEDADLADISREIADTIKRKKIYSTKMSEKRFGRSSARAIWCYFGHDESDIINHLYFAHSIWAADSEMRQLYFKGNEHAVEEKGIYIVENTSYEMLKRLQEPTMSRQDFIDENKKLLSTLVSMAESFIVDLQEVKNDVLSFEEMQTKYHDWIRRVREKYIYLSEGDIAPADLHEWTEEIMNLAGWVLDLSLLLENEKGQGIIGDREKWLINNSVRRYNESLEKLKQIENDIFV